MLLKLRRFTDRLLSKPEGTQPAVQPGSLFQTIFVADGPHSGDGELIVVERVTPPGQARRLDPEPVEIVVQAAPAPADPDRAAPDRVALEALIRANRFPEAADLAKAVAPAEQDQEWFIRAQLAISRRLGLHEDVLRFGQQLLQGKPDEASAYLARAAAWRALGRLAEAAAEAAIGLDRCPGALDLALEAAAIADAGGQPELGVQHLVRAAREGADPTRGYFEAVGLAMRLDRSELTQELIAEGLQANPANRGLLIRAARYAKRRQAWDEAEAHFSRLIALSPDDSALALEAAQALFGGRAGRERRLPFIFGVLDTLHARQPDFGPAYAFHLRVLREAKSFAKAETLLSGWIARCPDDPSLAVEAARLRVDQRDQAGAVDLLTRVRDRGVRHPLLDAELVRLLCLTGDFDTAERVCVAAIEPMPDNAALAERHVSLATRRGDMAEAARRIQQWRTRFPRSIPIANALKRLNLLHDEDVGHQPAAAAIINETARLFALFESLGSSSFGCEFGMVQKAFGADPIGLLRWSRSHIPGLLRGLEAGFAGIGEPENTSITVGAAQNGDLEYLLADKRYDYFGHTFIKQSEASREIVFRQTCRRLKFLRGKLMEDLAEARKIFVFKMTKFEGVDAVREIFGALRRHGPCTFLCATSVDPEHPAGTLQMLEPGLFLGRLARFGDMGPAGDAGIDMEGWKDLCRRVAAWHLSHTAAASEEA